MNHLIGSVLKRSVFTSSGSFLLSANTVLNEDHIKKLVHHNINISEDDVETLTFQIENKLLYHSVNKMKEVFQFSAYGKTIPLYEIRKEIVPVIDIVSSNHNLFRLLTDLHIKDDYTYTHNIAVGILAASVGKWMNLSNNDIQTLTIAALLHDIGKTKVPDHILLKPGKLTSEEFNEIKNHTVYGYEMLKSTIGASERIALVALQHHEREDGNGYPNGLKGNEIDIFSKIVAVCDVFQAMTSDRVYHEAIPFYLVLKEMWEESFGRLNANIMTVFIKRIMESTIGNKVILSNGEAGKVVMLNPFDPIYPIIKLDNGEIIDLNYNRAIYLEKVLD